MSKEPEEELEPFDPAVHRWPTGMMANPKRARDSLRSAASSLRESSSQQKRKDGHWWASKAQGGDCLYDEKLIDQLNELKKSLSRNAAISGNNKPVNDSLADECRDLATKFEQLIADNEERPERKKKQPPKP